MLEIATTLFALLLSADASVGHMGFALEGAVTSTRSGLEADARTPDGTPLVVVVAIARALGIRDVPDGAPLVVYGIEPDEID